MELFNKYCGILCLWVFVGFAAGTSRPAYAHLNAADDVRAVYQEMERVYEDSRILGADRPTLRLKTVTLNFGFLWEKFAWVPDYEVRVGLVKDQLKLFLREQEPDVFFCQEVWYAKDLDKIYLALRELKTETNGRLDYLASFGEKRRAEIEKKGLFFFVRKAILDPRVPFAEARLDDYKNKAGKPILFYGELASGYRRGLLNSTITLAGGARVLLGTTHLTPVITYSGPDAGQVSIRIAQAVALAEQVEEKAKEVDYVLIAGDLNTAPDWNAGMPEHKTIWASNIQPYVRFVQLSKLIDTFRIANPDSEGLTWSRRINPVTYWSAPTTPEQRIDFVWFGTFNPQLKYKIHGSRLVFNEPIRHQGTVVKSSLEEPQSDEHGYVLGEAKKSTRRANLFLSDHLGVLSDVELELRGGEFARRLDEKK